MLKWALAIGAAALVVPAVASAQDAAKGEAVFKASCSACHDLEKNKAGPHLKGVVGRKAGSLADYTTYSAGEGGLKDSGLTWDEATLDKWVSEPQKKMVPKTTMNFPGIKDAQKRMDLIAFLKSKV